MSEIGIVFTVGVASFCAGIAAGFWSCSGKAPGTHQEFDEGLNSPDGWGSEELGHDARSLNRQARRWYDDPWENFGNVTHADAAKQFAEGYGTDRLMRVMTREAGENREHEWFFHDVAPVVEMKVTSLRGH